MEKNLYEINAGIQNAYVDSTINSNLAYSPQFLTNNYKNGAKVLTYIERELMHCDEFSISVAFINRSGFVALSQTLKELEKRGIRGRILTTDYLTFSDPYALDRLNELSNVAFRSLENISRCSVSCQPSKPETSSSTSLLPSQLRLMMKTFSSVSSSLRAAAASMKGRPSRRA